MPKILLILIFGVCPFLLWAQTDTEFWFAPPDISSHFDNGGNFDRPIQLRLTSAGALTNVQITMPANASFTPINQVINANATVTVNLTTWIDILETAPPNQVLNSGLLIQSDNPITAYYENVSNCGFCNPEIFILKGRNALGNDFYIPLQNVFANTTSYSPLPTNSFDIVAVEDNTTVTITPSKNVVGHNASIPYTINLNRGQTYSATATGYSGPDHLTGSFVHADKPIAITMKDDLLSNAAYGLCADLGGDQIIPVNKTGTTYIAIKGFLFNPYDRLTLIATQNNTSVTINGVNVGTFNAGQAYVYALSGPTAYITSSAPIYVSQLTGSGCEVGLGCLPPLGCTGSQRVSFSRTAADQLYLDILAPAGIQSSFLLNGSPSIITAADFLPVNGTGGQWLYAQKIISTTIVPAGAVLTIQNNAGLFHAGIVHGSLDWGSRFGYFSDFNTLQVTTTEPTILCPGKDIQLSASSVINATYSWTGPDGFTSNLPNPLISNGGPQHEGTYYVTANYQSCSSIDSVIVALNENPVLNMPDTLFECSSSITLDAGAGYSSYLWSTGASTATINVTNTGKYFVTVTSQEGCSGEDSTYANVQAIDVSVSLNGSLCEGEDIQLNSLSEAGASYSWTGPNGFTSQQQNPLINNSNVQDEGTYYVMANYQSCSSIDSIAVTINSKPVLNLPDTLRSCVSPVVLDAGAGYNSYLWNTGGNTATINVVNTGKYFITVTNEEGCSVEDSIFADIQAIEVDASSNALAICMGENIQLNASPVANSGYSWTGPDGFASSQQNPLITNSNILNEGKYYVTVSNQFCSDIDSVIITVNENPVLNIADTLRSCLTTVELDAGAGYSSYSWSTGGNTAIINVTNTGKYFVTVTNVEGCSAEDSIFADIQAVTVTAEANPPQICEGEDIYLNAVSAPGVSYSWTGPNGFISSQQNPSISSGNMQNEGVYSVTASNQFCNAVASVMVDLNENPVLNIPDTVFSCTSLVTLDAGSGFSSYLWNTGSNSQSIQTSSTGKYFITVENMAGCSAIDSIYADIQVVTIDVQPAGPAELCIGGQLVLSGIASQTYAYQWYNNSVAITGANTDQLIVTQQGNYSLIASNSGGCEDTVWVTVAEKSKPSLEGPEEITLCIGQSDTLKVKGGDSYTWSPTDYLDNPAIANPETTPLDSITYEVHVIENICLYDTTIRVVVNANSSGDVVAQKSGDIDCSHPSIQLSATGGNSYIWSPVTGLSDPQISNPVVMNISNDMTYMVQATALNGCIGYDTLQVKVLAQGEPVLYMPDAFTPNNDGLNDCFGISAATIEKLEEFSIYNRWGQKIFTTQNPQACWNGTYKGVRQDSGAFVYIVKAKTGCGDIFKKGIVLLIR